MASQLIENHRENAEIYYGEAICKQKWHELLAEHSLPKGLIPIKVLELGYNRSSGFIWLKQKHKMEFKDKHFNKTSSYAAEITAFIEKGRLKNVTGIKTKILILWIALTDMYIDDPSSGKMVFAASNGMSRSLPISLFALEDDKDDGQKSSN